MKYIITKSAITFHIVALFLFTSLGSYAQIHHNDFQDGKLYLKFKDTEHISFTVNADQSVDVNSVPFIKELAEEFTVTELSRPFYLNNDHKLLRTLMLKIGDYSQIDNVIARLSREDVLEYVEKVPLDKIMYTPNDSLYNLYNGPQNWNWHLELIQAELAWNITRGDSNIKVAVVDNAVWVDHPDLTDKIIAQRDVVYGTNNANPPGTGDPGDWSHGTHVAGLIGASSDNHVGVASIGYDVSIIAVKAANNNTPRSISSGYTGIQWAANNGADVINMSWGGNQFSQTNQNIINTISNMGIVLIAAAGNDNVSTPHYPSAFQNVISVASVDYNDTKSDFSNFSSTVDVSSPGGVASPGPAGVLSTTYSSGTYGNYDAYIGTSMASPVVAGLAGLILSVNPELTPAQVELILESTADDISIQNPNYIGLLGSGRINAYRAVSNTPFEPTAAFQTPVVVIMPGNSIDFSDLSVGLPSTWNWVFEGASPSTSNDTNPQNILYQTEGLYDVSLTVTNAFGTNTITYPDYIQVSANPVPYVFVNISDSLPCIAETVTLSDNSLYNPTSWEWTIEPATFVYVNGTTSSSQQPQIEFLRQGQYNISLSASNQNGSGSGFYTNAIHVQGIAPPYTLNLEEGTAEYFVLWDTIRSQSAVDSRAANNSSYGIHFHGDPIPVGWKGTPTGGTPEQAWNENLSFQSEAHLCGVDARGFTNVKLAFDLRQTYSLGVKYSWFRVLVDGNPVADFEGTVDFNPMTPGDDPWRKVQFDLSQYAGTVFDITLQACNRFSDKVQGQGDNVFIDNIEIVNSVPVVDLSKSDGEVKIFPNPSNGVVNIVVSNIKENSTIEVRDARGKIVYRSLLTQGLESQKLQINNLSAGLYMVRVLMDKQIVVTKLIVS